MVAIEDVEKIGEVGQDCQIRVLESCSSQVRSGQVRMARGRWNLTLASPQVDEFKLPKLSHAAKITGCEAVTISKLQMAEVGEGSEEGQARGWEVHVVELKACEMLAFGQWVQLDVGNEMVPSPSPSCEALQSRQGGEVMESGASPVGIAVRDV